MDSTQSSSDSYSNFEIDTDQCLDNWFGSYDIDVKELKKKFEDYFADGNISDSKDPLYKQY